MAVRKSVPDLQETASRAAIRLSPARLAGDKSLEECLRSRRSCRMFADTYVPLEYAAQLLWAAQGITGLGGLRTAPSAGAVYPLRAYLIAMRVDGLPAGAYAYDPYEHVLSLCKAGDLRAELLQGACDQEEVQAAALAVLLTARYSLSKREFGENGVLLALMEAGHVAQNVLLQATALSLGSIGFGKLDEAAIRRALDLRAIEQPVYLLLAGHLQD